MRRLLLKATGLSRARVAHGGDRRKPRPEDRPGFVRVDSVRQGDLDGRKGVYESNPVDEVTQLAVLSACCVSGTRHMRL